MARMRMIYLYDLAQKNKGMVLSTDNLTEYYLGFWTLHGDVGDFGMIQQLWKTEVYEMTRWLYETKYKNLRIGSSIMSSINKAPTDGLGISDGDLEQLGANTYEKVDDILKRYFEILETDIEEEDIIRNHSVIKRHKASEFKRHVPINVERSVILNGEI